MTPLEVQSEWMGCGVDRTVRTREEGPLFCYLSFENECECSQNCETSPDVKDLHVSATLKAEEV